MQVRRLVPLIGPLVVMAAVLGLCLLVAKSFAVGVQWDALVAGLIVNIVAALAAAVPLVWLANSKTETLLSGTMAAMGLRIVLTLGGAVLAMGSGWALDRTSVITWTTIFYMAVLASETTVAVWLVRTNKN